MPALVTLPALAYRPAARHRAKCYGLRRCTIVSSTATSTNAIKNSYVPIIVPPSLKCRPSYIWPGFQRLGRLQYRPRIPVLTTCTLLNIIWFNRRRDFFCDFDGRNLTPASSTPEGHEARHRRCHASCEPCPGNPGRYPPRLTPSALNRNASGGSAPAGRFYWRAELVNEVERTRLTRGAPNPHPADEPCGSAPECRQPGQKDFMSDWGNKLAGQPDAG